MFFGLWQYRLRLGQRESWVRYVGELIDRSQVKVTRIVPTPRSVIR